MIVKYIPHMWYEKVIGLGYRYFSFCKHCGMERDLYKNAQNKIEEDFLLGKISIEKQKNELAELEKCLTREEAVVKDVLT